MNLGWRDIFRGIILMAIGASAKAIIDVARLEERVLSLKEYMQIIHTDVKYIKRVLDERVLEAKRTNKNK